MQLYRYYCNNFEFLLGTNYYHVIVTVAEFKRTFLNMEQVKQEKFEESHDFKIINVYSLSDLTSSDAGVSGECNNEVKIKCETKDFPDSTDQLTDDNSLQQNIKQEPQSDNISTSSYPLILHVTKGF